MSRSVVDTTASAAQAAVWIEGVGVTIEGTTVRRGLGTGVNVTGAGTRMLTVRIEGSGGIGLEASAGFAQTSGVRVVGSGSYPVRATIQGVAGLVQDSLLGNGRDTVIITGGTLVGAAATVQAALPWRVTANVTVDAGAVLRTEPGARLVVVGGSRTSSGTQPGLIAFANGGRLEARGTAAQPVVFTVHDTTQTWQGLRFTGTPPDTSYLTNARVEHAGGHECCYPSHAAVDVRSPHAVVMDSAVIRRSTYGAVSLQAAGSRLSRSLVDTTHTGYSGASVLPAVTLGADTKLEGTTVRRSVARGVHLAASNVGIMTCEVAASASDGVYLATGTGVTINNCNLVNNAGLGVNNVSGTLIDATNNWWGDAAGPTGPSGDGVSANVTYIPFLTSPVTLPGPFSAPPAPVAPASAARGGK
jgi:hypothetical protein